VPGSSYKEGARRGASLFTHGAPWLLTVGPGSGACAGSMRNSGPLWGLRELPFASRDRWPASKHLLVGTKPIRRRSAAAIMGTCALVVVLVSGCGGYARGANALSTAQSTRTAVRSALHVAAWPPRAVAAFKKPWIEGCAASPAGGTSKPRCTILFNCLRDSFNVAEFERLSVGYFQGGALPTHDRARVVGCLSRAHISPSG